MIVWGGGYFDAGGNFVLLADGGRYDPVGDVWLPVSPAAAPGPVLQHRAVWTGEEMIVWGASSVPWIAPEGARYDPLTDSWTPTSDVGAPGPRWQHSAVWTGTEMIVWGGFRVGWASYEQTGGRYDPVADAWIPTTLAGAPTGSDLHGAVWTGSEMIVWGGRGPAGGSYTPATDAWSASPAPETATPVGLAMLWSGNALFVFGGRDDYTGPLLPGGRLYDPTTDLWTAASTVGEPAARYHHGRMDRRRGHRVGRRGRHVLRLWRWRPVPPVELLAEGRLLHHRPNVRDAVPLPPETWTGNARSRSCFPTLWPKTFSS